LSTNVDEMGMETKFSRDWCSAVKVLQNSQNGSETDQAWVGMEMKAVGWVVTINFYRHKKITHIEVTVVLNQNNLVQLPFTMTEEEIS